MKYLPVENDKRLLSIIAVLIAAIVLVWVFLPGQKPNRTTTAVVGDRERINILIGGRSIEAVAKIDTGADYSSIDTEFARSLGLAARPTKHKTVSNAQGVERRDTVRFTYELAGRKIKSTFTLADRSGLSALVLIGRKDLKGMVVDPGKAYVTQPERSNLDASEDHPHKLDNHGFQMIKIFPVLGFLVVFMRLLVGIRTYGIFGPVVIAFSLFEMDILQGMLIYASFVAVGIIVKLLIFNRFQLPYTTEMSMIIYVLVASLVATISLAENYSVSFGAVFFPLIITSFLIERATNTIEEHRITDALSLLFSTIAIAMLLAFAGKFLLELDPSTINAIFALSFLALIVIGKYKGLRLTEYIRFRFLRKGNNAPH